MSWKRRKVNGPLLGDEAIGEDAVEVGDAGVVGDGMAARQGLHCGRQIQTFEEKRIGLNLALRGAQVPDPTDVTEREVCCVVPTSFTENLRLHLNPCLLPRLRRIWIDLQERHRGLETTMLAVGSA